MFTFWAVLKTSIFVFKLLYLLLEILRYFIFQRLVTLYYTTHFNTLTCVSPRIVAVVVVRMVEVVPSHHGG